MWVEWLSAPPNLMRRISIERTREWQWRKLKVEEEVKENREAEIWLWGRINL